MASAAPQRAVRFQPTTRSPLRRRRRSLLPPSSDRPPSPLPSSPTTQPWELFTEKMTEAGLSQAAQDSFKMNYEQLVAGVTGLVGAGTPRCVGGWEGARLGGRSDAAPSFRLSCPASSRQTGLLARLCRCRTPTSTRCRSCRGWMTCRRAPAPAPAWRCDACLGCCCCCHSCESVADARPACCFA